jgi:hypothetical protein
MDSQKQSSAGRKQRKQRVIVTGIGNVAMESMLVSKKVPDGSLSRRIVVVLANCCRTGELLLYWQIEDRE